MDSIIKRMGAKGASGSTAAEGATICAEGADEGVSVGDSSIVTIGAKGAVEAQQLKAQQYAPRVQMKEYQLEHSS